MPAIRQHCENGILILTIDNESRRNAFTHSMTAAMGDALRNADADAGVRCVVITGAGDLAFSSGHDIQEMLADRDAASDPELNQPFLLPARMLTPTIAAVNGPAYGAGFILALACDLRVCAEHASFTAPGARIGLLPIGGQLSRLPALLPRAVAHEMLITCRPLGAEEAVRLGFASRTAARGQTLEEALALAAAIAGNSAVVVRAVKQGLNVQAQQGLDQAMAFEWQTGRALQDGADAQEGMSAFLEKRPPRFS